MQDDTQVIPQDDEITEGDIVQDNPTTSSVTEDNSNVLLSLDEMIKLTISSMDRIKEELTKAREMVNDALLSDANYKQMDDKVKEATKERTRVKKDLLGKPGMMELSQKVKNLSEEIKEKDASLSDYVMEYQRMADVNQIELPNGEILEIIQSAKVVRKRR